MHRNRTAFVFVPFASCGKKCRFHGYMRLSSEAGFESESEAASTRRPTWAAKHQRVNLTPGGGGRSNPKQSAHLADALEAERRERLIPCDTRNGMRYVDAHR